MADPYLSLQLHIVWSTARREPLLSNKWREKMYLHLGTVVGNQGGRLLRAGGTVDHVHACVDMPPTVTVATMVDSMKNDTASWVQMNHRSSRTFSWQKGYGAFTVGKSAQTVICEYILEQEEHHRMWSFQEEFVSLLKLHQIDFDERSLWD